MGREGLSWIRKRAALARLAHAPQRRYDAYGKVVSLLDYLQYSSDQKQFGGNDGGSSP
jgi:hypothetical protein